MAATTATVGRRRPGRPRDPCYDKVILRASLDILLDKGYAALTVDGVAAKTGVGRPTIYRRWSSKPPTPDTGNLRDDLLAFQRQQVTMMDAAASRRITAGLVADLVADPELSETYFADYIAPRRMSVWQALQRGVDRGELPADADFTLIYDLLLGPLFMRSVVLGEPLGPDMAEHTVDLVLTAFGDGGTPRRGRESSLPGRPKPQVTVSKPTGTVIKSKVPATVKIKPVSRCPSPRRWPPSIAIGALRALWSRRPSLPRPLYSTEGISLDPRPVRAEGPPIWVGSWGSEAGLRRTARLADGGLASPFNTTPALFMRIGWCRPSTAPRSSSGTACQSVRRSCSPRSSRPSPVPGSKGLVWPVADEAHQLKLFWRPYGRRSPSSARGCDSLRRY